MSLLPIMIAEILGNQATAESLEILCDKMQERDYTAALKHVSGLSVVISTLALLKDTEKTPNPEEAVLLSRAGIDAEAQIIRDLLITHVRSL